MIRARSFIAVAWGALLIVGSGCVDVPKDAGFPAVQQTVAERTGQRAQWDQDTDAQHRVAEAIRPLLQNELSADSAVQVALLNNQNLQATYEDLGIAQAEVVEAGLLSNPTISAEIRFPMRPKYPFDIDVTQSFLELLYLPLRKSAAEAAFESAKLRVTDEVLKTAAETKATFYRVQGAEQLVEMRRTVLAAADASFEAATKLHDAGNITDLAFANERAMAEQAKIELARAESAALDAREDLSALMGVWAADASWTIAARLPELPADKIDPKGLETLAVARRLDLAAARQEIERTAQSLGITKASSLFPYANLSAHAEGEADGVVTVGPSIEVPLPIFNQGQPAIAAAQARLRQNQRRYAAMAVQIRSDVRRGRNRLFAARDLAVYYSRVIVPLRHEIVAQNLLQYNAMQIGVFQLLQAKRDEIDAGREYVEALRDYWVARTELERIVGGTLTDVAAPTSQPATVPSVSTTQQNPHVHGGTP